MTTSPVRMLGKQTTVTGYGANCPKDTKGITVSSGREMAMSDNTPTRDILIVRDHRYGCEHQPSWIHAHEVAGEWCPGGMEIVLRRHPITYDYRTEGPNSYIEGRVNFGQELTTRWVWVEVTDE